MGMSHEQTRLDRDKFIKVIWSNVKPGWEPQYTKTVGSAVYDIPYDYASNMHYTGCKLFLNGFSTYFTVFNIEFRIQIFASKYRKSQKH